MYTLGHPYHGSVIGRDEDLQAATLADVRAFFDRYYRPNNALLAVVGDFDPTEARDAVLDRGRRFQLILGFSESSR